MKHEKYPRQAASMETDHQDEGCTLDYWGNVICKSIEDICVKEESVTNLIKTFLYDHSFNAKPS